MSKNYGNGPKVELKLKLNLSPPRTSQEQQPCMPLTMTSPPSSCLTSDMEDVGGLMGFSSDGAPEEASTMVLVGCPRCLMYVMLSDKEPRCPRCKSTALLHFLNNTTSHKRIAKH